MPTKFGTQPAYDALFHAGHNLTSAAERLGLGRNHVKNCLHGRGHPSIALSQGLSELLGIPEDQLFTAEALDARRMYPVVRRTRAQRAQDQTAGARR